MHQKKERRIRIRVEHFYQTCRPWRRACGRRGRTWGPRSRWDGRTARRTRARSPPAAAGSGAPILGHEEFEIQSHTILNHPKKKSLLQLPQCRAESPARNVPRSPPWGWGFRRGRWWNRRPRARRWCTAPGRGEKEDEEETEEGRYGRVF